MLPLRTRGAHTRKVRVVHRAGAQLRGTQSRRVEWVMATKILWRSVATARRRLPWGYVLMTLRELHDTFAAMTRRVPFLVPLSVAIAAMLGSGAPTAVTLRSAHAQTTKPRDDEDTPGSLLLDAPAREDPVLLAHRSHSSHRSHVSGSGGGGGGNAVAAPAPRPAQPPAHRSGGDGPSGSATATAAATSSPGSTAASAPPDNAAPAPKKGCSSSPGSPTDGAFVVAATAAALLARRKRRDD